MTEETLSDKRTDLGDMNDIYLYFEKDVKDFIKKLKEGLSIEDVNDDSYLFQEAHERILKLIDTLAGKELIE